MIRPGESPGQIGAEETQPMTHIVALSGGKDSTALALKLAQVEPRPYVYVCTPTGDELPPMVDHWLRLGQRLGRPIMPVSCGQSLGGLIARQQALPNWRMRWCTRMLKIEPFEAFVLTHMPCTVYVGIRADETGREGVDYEAMSTQIQRRYPLVEWGWGKADVLGYLKAEQITIPPRTDCAACFFQTLGEWHALWRTYPARYAQAEGWEALTGHTLRSPQRDTQPTGLRPLREKFEGGYTPQRRTMTDRETMCATCAR